MLVYMKTQGGYELLFLMLQDTWQKPLKKEGVYFGSEFEGAVHHGGEGVATGVEAMATGVEAAFRVAS